MAQKKHVITRVLEGSIAGELELEAGDSLLTINGMQVEDVFDYRYLMNDELITVEIEKPDGEVWELEIEKEYEEDLGIEFASGLMDDYRSCSNRCLFCFIDQMPPGMRETLYFKDDDSRLSFLQGNYITLTNLHDHDVERMIRFHLEPVNISFHTTNPELRCRMLHNRFAGRALKIARRLYEAGITMNGQIVLCKGINDGAELERTIRDLSGYAPVLKSLSIVPVGLTKYREGLYPLEPFDRQDAKELIRQVRIWQQKMKALSGLNFVHASDEWYLMAGEPLPDEESYDGYPQLENGVGMLRLQEEEFTKALAGRKADDRKIRKTIATGLLAAPVIEKLMERMRERFPGVEIFVEGIENRFFGERITVSGLITGQDLIAQLKGKDLGEELLVPCNMLRSQEDVFLDDITVSFVEQELGTRVRVVDRGGDRLLEAALSVKPAAERETDRKRRQSYEQTSGSHRRKA